MSIVVAPPRLPKSDAQDGGRDDTTVAAATVDSPSVLPADVIVGAQPSDDFLRLIPHEFARRHLVVSSGVTASAEERVLHADNTSPVALFNIGVRLGRPLTCLSAPGEAIASVIDRAYAARRVREHDDDSADEDTASADIAMELTPDAEEDLQAVLRSADANLLSTSGKAPVTRLVDLLLFEALRQSASDVHIQPLGDRALIRYRLDGVLHTVREVPLSLVNAVTTRVKVMAKLDVAERRAPQDGRATVTIGGSGGTRRVDLRISTLPTTYGERVVIRLLDTSSSSALLNFASLGMPADVERRYKQQISRTSGIVLVTGPTGSGKTTTLYTTLAWVTQVNSAAARARGCELNIMTIEDPVEYDLSTAGLTVSQTQLNAKKGVTFAAGLRHILRQDPDVIMVGEVRDEETARIAVQSSLTGHLVLSTLHTNDAPSAVARLLDLKVEPFLAASSLSAVLAQRLVRKVHSECSGAGCEACLTTGYRGRTGVFELLVLDEAMREMVTQHAAAGVLRHAACQRGMRTLLQAGLEMVKLGATSRDELARVIEGSDCDEQTSGRRIFIAGPSVAEARVNPEVEA